MMRLKENEGTHKILSSIKLEESWTWPMWVTKTDSPLGSSTDIWVTKVIFVSKEIEWTMWSVAPLSIIQSFGEMSEGTTRFDEKIEWSKVIKVCKQREVVLSNEVTLSKSLFQFLQRKLEIWTYLEIVSTST